MKLATAQIAAFLQKPDPAVRVVLVYGPDAGLARERADGLAKKIVSDLNDPFRIAALPGSAIAEDSARLGDEMAAVSLGGGRRLVRIQHAAENVAPALAALLSSMPGGDSFLLIEAGDLEKRSKLRALCENDPALACAVPCYVEEGAARQRIISDILQASGLKAERDALMLLADILPPDRLAMRSELDKLALYMGEKKSVTLEDALAVVQDAGAAELDDLVHAVGAGEAKRAALLLDRLLGEQTSPVALLRAAQRHFLRLQWARGQMEKGASAQEAVKRLQPPVFWKYADKMSNEVRNWPEAKLAEALRRLYEAEAAVKRTGTPDAALCSQLFLAMATSRAAS